MFNSTQNKVLICRGCLSTDGKLFNINTKRISTEYCLLTGLKIPENEGLQYICYICTALLHKFMKFRNKCLDSRKLLDDIQCDFTSESKLKKLKIHSDSYCQYTNIQTHDYQPDKTVTNGTDVILKHKDTIKPSVNTDSKIDVKIKEDIDESVVKIKNEDLNDSQIADLDSDSDEQFLVNNFSHSGTNDKKVVKDNIEAESSDDQALVTFKSSHKTEINTTKTRIRKLQKHTTIKQKFINKNESKIAENHQKQEYGFENKDNLDDFERMFNVDVVVLSKDEQIKDVLDRRTGVNYLHSPYRCESCFKGFMDEDNLNKHHMAQHDINRGNIVCEFCKFRYKDKRSLNQHLKKHRLKFACRQCKYISRTAFNAKEHYKMHGGQMHKCQQCGKCYEKLSSHLSHVRIHHPSELVWCEYCGESFIGEFGLNGHKKRAHHNLKFPTDAVCVLCNTKFINLEALYKHRNRQTKSSCEISCVHCGNGFDARSELKDHLLEVHRSKKKYSCEKCSKTFTKESLYSAHYRRMHVDVSRIDRHNKMADWICEVCGKVLPSKCLLVYHQRNHTGERPYQCDECSKSFTMRKLLHSHMRVHTTARPYSCKICPKTFKGLSALRSHENIHAGVKTKISSIQM